MNPGAPTHIRLRRQSRVMELEYPDGARFSLSFEYLRVYSPSAEVRGHGGGEGYLQSGKKNVMLVAAEPVGNYALKLSFDDGHDSGLFSWQYLYELGRDQQVLWQRYLERLEAAGASRGPAEPAPDSSPQPWTPEQ